jgi:hypothetical protein
MKKCLLLLAFLAVYSINAQVVKYHRVLMRGDQNLQKTLLSLGITIDHSDKTNEGIVAEISEMEVDLLKKNQIDHTVLISDMANYYEKRNLEDIQNKTMAPQDCNKSTLTKPTYFHLGTMGGYFKFNEVTQILDSMALLYPNLITVKQALNPLSVEGRYGP